LLKLQDKDNPKTLATLDTRQRQSRDTGNIGHNTQYNWIVFVLCIASNVASVSGLSLSCVLCPMLSVSLDCLCLVID
jgi:hypothetical protein